MRREQIGEERPRIPATMMTQHPDSASRYVPIQEEPEEAIEALLPPPGGLGLDEVMVDFEGKLTPYQQTSQIVVGLAEAGLMAGRDAFVTPRIPSGEEEGVFRQLMALMSVVESNYRSFKKHGIYAVREVILPMTRSAKELISVRERVNDVIALAHKEFGLSPDPKIISLIPLFETAPQILNVFAELSSYVEASAELGAEPSRLRYMLGFSDLALSYGFVAAAIAVKLGLADGYRLASEKGVEVAPILGGGTLPFRGQLVPENLDNLLRDYPGVRTVTIQSAMRYDRGAEKTRKFADELKNRLPKSEPSPIPSREFHFNAIGIFSKHYLMTFYKLMRVAAALSDIVPRQRDRLARKGESGYARDVPHPNLIAELVTEADLARQLREIALPEKVELPRAISYAAALYSIGLPPEIVGTGRGLSELAERFGRDAVAKLESEFGGLRSGLSFSLRFVQLEVAADFLPEEVLFEVEEDLRCIGEILGIEPGPLTKEDRLYRTVLEAMRPMLKELVGVKGEERLITDESVEGSLVRDWIVRLGCMRGGLG